jgi:hypothetical protein
LIMLMRCIVVARVVDGVGYCRVEVIGDAIVLVAVGVEQCLVVGLQALSKKRSETSTVSYPKYVGRCVDFVQ